MAASRHWSLEGPPFIRRSIETEPALAALWHELNGKHPAIDRDFLTRHDLRALPLIEAWVKPREVKLFDILREAGSTRGWFLPHPDSKSEDGHFHDCWLSEAALTEIEGRFLFERDFIFTDNQLNCLIVGWFTDFTMLCLKPPLFERLLQRSPENFAIDGEAPDALSFQDALAQAFQRFDDWCQTRPADESMRPLYFDPLHWQFEPT